ncbi:MAG: hypothetical protein HC860_26335 [Alkalinema sp. RU_4_3]|nr:hypothetical protein [Alkalinema sp. RU_4_3]
MVSAYIPGWVEHFEWSADGVTVVGRTAVGRVTGGGVADESWGDRGGGGLRWVGILRGRGRRQGTACGTYEDMRYQVVGVMGRSEGYMRRIVGVVVMMKGMLRGAIAILSAIARFGDRAASV